jgi:hypothetical protein
MTSPIATISTDGSFVHVAWHIPAPNKITIDVFASPVTELSVATATFQEAWATMEAKGYQYGEDALESVRVGWELGTLQLKAVQTDLEKAKQDLAAAMFRLKAAEMLIDIHNRKPVLAALILSKGDNRTPFSFATTERAISEYEAEGFKTVRLIEKD